MLLCCQAVIVLFVFEKLFRYIALILFMSLSFFYRKQNMSNDKILRCEIERQEGYRKDVYKDSLEISTGGIGHMIRSDEKGKYPVGSKVSKQQVEQWYKDDIESGCNAASSFLGKSNYDKLSDERKRAMCNLGFNLGGTRLNKFTKFKSAMVKEDYDTAANELENSKWFGQVGKRGPEVANMIRKSKATGRIASCSDSH